MTDHSDHLRQHLIDRLVDLAFSDDQILTNFLRDVTGPLKKFDPKMGSLVRLVK